MLEQIKANLKELDFDSNEIKVYLASTQLGESPASAIAKKAGLHRTTTISILERLAEAGYLSLHRYRGVTYYWVESPKTLEASFTNKAAIAGQLGGLLTDLYRSEANFPFANVYDTKKAIKNFIEKVLLNTKRGGTIYTIDAPHQGNYAKIYSDDFHNQMMEIKKKRNIKTFILIPTGTYREINLNKLKGQEVVVRELPAGIKFDSSLWFVDKFAVLFSGKPPFIVAVHHRSIVTGLKSIYDFLWSLSKEIV